MAAAPAHVQVRALDVGIVLPNTVGGWVQATPDGVIKASGRVRAVATGAPDITVNWGGAPMRA